MPPANNIDGYATLSNREHVIGKQGQIVGLANT